MAKTVTVAVTGTAGQIGYSLLPRLASGEVFGPDTHVNLRLYDITPALKALEGVVMELDDCAFSALHSVMITDDVESAFDGINWAILVGSKPRTKGMERGDLIRENGPIFVGQGKALQRAASDVRALVVGNPANTNCMIAMRNAGDLPRDRFSALTRLDHNRAAAQLAGKAGCHVTEVSNVTIWGNHSATQYPDFENAKIGGRPAMEVIQDHEWLRGEFIANVQQRGAAIIAARGLSSAASAANAAIDHIQSFLTPTPEGDWFSAAIPSDGSYGIEKDLIFSYPLVSDGKSGLTIVQDLPMSDFAKEKLRATEEELKTEKVLVQDLLG